MVTRLFLLASAACFALASAWAQSSTNLQSVAGTWLVTVEGIADNETRTLIIASDSISSATGDLAAKYGLTSKSKTPIEAKLTPNRTPRQLIVVTQAASVITADENSDGSFSGTFVAKGGKSHPVRIVRITDAQLAESKADQPAKLENFSPYELVGNWQFVSSNSGTTYGGDIKVSVGSMDKSGAMRGMISYDGRQLNDACGTRGVFSDEPVDAEIIKSKGGYRISFMAKCLRGQSPRPFNWTLVCEGATCSRPTVEPHGRGALTLTEKR